MSRGHQRQTPAGDGNRLRVLDTEVPAWTVAAALAGLIGLASLTATNGLADWVATHWLFRYSDGLRRRSLVGSAISWVLPVEAPRFGLVLLLSLLAFGLLVVLLVRLSLRALRRGGDPWVVLLVLVLVVSPGTLRYLAMDLGRFDTINLALVVGVLLVLPRLAVVGQAVLVAVVGVVGVLVHELFLVAFLPLLLAALALTVQSAPTKLRLPRLLGLLLLTAVPSLAAALWVLSAPILTARDITALAVTLASRTDFPPNDSSLLIHARDLNANFAYTAASFANPRRRLIEGTLVPVALTLPTLLVALASASMSSTPPTRAGQRWLPTPPREVWLLLAAGSTPLALHAIGIDYGRWWALTTCNIVIAVLWWHTRTGVAPGPDAPAGEASGPSTPEQHVSTNAALGGVGLLLMLSMLPVPDIVQWIAQPNPMHFLSQLLDAVRTAGFPW